MAEAPSGRVQETTQVFESKQVRPAAPLHLQLMMNVSSGKEDDVQLNRQQTTVCNNRCDTWNGHARLWEFLFVFEARVFVPLTILFVFVSLVPTRTSPSASIGNEGENVNMDQLWDDPSPCATQYGAILDNLDAIKPSRMPPTSGILMQSASGHLDRFDSTLTDKSSATEMVRQHPTFEKLVRAHYSCRKMIASEEQRKVMDSELMKIIARLSSVRSNSGGGDSSGRNDRPSAPIVRETDISVMLEEYCDAIDKFMNEMKVPHEQAKKAFDDLRSQLESITSSVESSAEEDPNTFIGFLKTDPMFAGMSPSRKCEILKEHYKRRHADALMDIHDDFMGLKKTKKLPEDAVSHLKVWWHANIAWPYPTEDEKEQFMVDTKLDGTQISNWFINQRKRHWHKFFWDGLPQCEREALEHIKRHNLLAKLHQSSA